VDQSLYSTIFGESILNDAVCVVMFRYVHTYQEIELFTLPYF
jgi:NhaP-type Na+/H+ or K+/H+ antiporter